jgi:cell wall-associated NlpC family hydrolase
MSQNVAELRARVVATARDFIFTPYHHQGMLKGIGVDCLTILILVYREVGVVPLDFNPGNYSREWYMHKSEELYLAGVQKFARRIPDGDPVLPGDVALYKVGKCVSHGAIIVDENLLIHANRKAGQVEIIERRNIDLVTHLHSYWTPFP